MTLDLIADLASTISGLPATAVRELDRVQRFLDRAQYHELLSAIERNSGVSLPPKCLELNSLLALSIAVDQVLASVVASGTYQPVLI